MKEKFIKSLWFFMTFLMVFPLTLTPSIKTKASGGTIDDFVERCYTVTLDRGTEPD